MKSIWIGLCGFGLLMSLALQNLTHPVLEPVQSVLRTGNNAQKSLTSSPYASQTSKPKVQIAQLEDMQKELAVAEQNFDQKQIVEQLNRSNLPEELREADFAKLRRIVQLRERILGLRLQKFENDYQNVVRTGGTP